MACDRATTGERIPVYDRPQVAFVVVDLHRDNLGAEGLRSVDAAHVEPMLAAVNRLVESAKPHGVTVAFVKSEAHGDLDPRVTVGGNPVFGRRRSDAFESRELDEFLRTRGVDHLVIAGAFASGAVSLTSEGARNRGYKVQVVGDAVGDASDGKKRTAIDRLRQSGVEIIDTERVLAEWERRQKYLGSR